METRSLHIERDQKELHKEDKAPPPPPAPPPPSSATSPSHEFSFTITLQPSSLNSSPSSILRPCNKAAPSAFAVDLAPADDIFFHGHLLPLQLLSHPNAPPRQSDICNIESFSFPLERVDSDRCLKYHTSDHHHHGNVVVDNGGNKERIKTKVFSFHFGLGKLRKGRDNGGEKEDEKKKKKKKMFDMSRFLKKYANMMETIFFFKSAEKAKHDLRRRPYSFSGHSNRKESDGWRRKKGQFSAPASMRTSPTNSGLLAARPTTFSSSDNSTMEELQSAIQAAIAHCKNSVAMKEEKCKC